MAEAKESTKEKASGAGDQAESIWTTERVNDILRRIDEGATMPRSNPFRDKDIDWRAPNIVFEYTDWELAELRKCADDVIYFANRYCFAMTDDGVQNITLRDYQEDVLRDYKENRFCIFLSSRQSGKTISSSIFLAHYLLFNTDKNLMILANVSQTTEELIDKIKTILKNLPFFMKPGVLVNNVMSMKLDNGCRLIGRTTTKNTGIGFTIHCLYIDEFAHIHPNFINYFYRAVYPTLSASKISRLIITSTANGMNKFYEIYTAALSGQNEFKAIRVDWWQVPGRDEEWRLREIANLGSEEDFNQEYGNQFISSSSLLLDGPTLRRLKPLAVEYVWRELSAMHDREIDHSKLKWHPKFDLENIAPTDRFVLTIDLSGGGGGDQLAINILKLVPLPLPMIKSKISWHDESDFFGLLQVGLFRDNRTSPEEVQPLLESLIYEVLGSENVAISLEINFKGDLLYDRMMRHDGFFEELFVHTKHTDDARVLKPGIKLNPKNKFEFCMQLRPADEGGRIITTEKRTFEEAGSFGRTPKGTYKGQTGYDDVMMTLVNLVPYFTSPQFMEAIGARYDGLGEQYRKEIEKKLNLGPSDARGDIDDLSYLRDLM